MTAAKSWDADRAIAACTTGPWFGRAWRIHDRKYSPVDSTGSLNVSGRFNRGLDQFTDDQAWSVLYLARGRDVALDLGSEAILVPSATLLGDNLIVFDRNLRKSSRIDVVSSIDPRLLAE